MVEASEGAVEETEAVVLVDEKVLVKSRVLGAFLYLHMSPLCIPCNGCNENKKLQKSYKSLPLEEPADGQHRSSGFLRHKACESPLMENAFILLTMESYRVFFTLGLPQKVQNTKKLI